MRLSGFLPPYVAECPRPLEAIAQRLIVHFLPLFLDQNGPSISVSDGVDTIDLRTFFRENFAQLSTRQTLTVAGEAFKYVVHRRVILELLDKYLSQDQSTGDYGLEKTIHSLVFPMRSTSEDVPFEQQNLWIIDERLTFHTFLSSDVPLNKTPVLENGSASRPDLLIFNQPLAFSEDGEPLQAMVVVEFKKPDRTNYHDEDPITQVYRLVREIREGKKKNNQGRLIRPANDKVPAYCYIVCDLTPPVETRIQNMGARKTPDNLGYYGYNETLNAYFEIISYAKLLADAQKRNRVLFDKLNLPAKSDR